MSSEEGQGSSPFPRTFTNEKRIVELKYLFGLSVSLEAPVPLSPSSFISTNIFALEAESQHSKSIISTTPPSS